MSNYENIVSESKKFPSDSQQSQQNFIIPFMLVSPISQAKPKNKVEDILKA